MRIPVLTLPNLQTMAKEDQIRSDPMAQQKFQWIAMKERITRLVETTTVSNVQFVADQISKENLIHGRGLFCTAVLNSQSQFPESSNVYAALVAVINSRFPDAGHLLLKRAVLQFKEAHDSKDKERLRKASIFLAHLVNQRVAYEAVALDALMLLLAKPSSENVEVAVGLCRECGSLLVNVAPRQLSEMCEEFDRVRRRREVERRVEVMVEKLLAARRERFWEHPRVVEELDIVEDEERVTHDVCLLQELDTETYLDHFVEY